MEIENSDWIYYGYNDYNKLTDKYVPKNPVMEDELLSYIIKINQLNKLDT